MQNCWVNELEKSICWSKCCTRVFSIEIIVIILQCESSPLPGLYQWGFHSEVPVKGWTWTRQELPARVQAIPVLSLGCALNGLGVSAEPKCSSVVFDRMIWTTVIRSWSSAQLSWDFVSPGQCAVCAWFAKFFLWQGNSHTGHHDGVAPQDGWDSLRLHLWREQYHYLLGISVAGRGRVRITQGEDTLSSKSTLREEPLMFKWQRLTADSKLEVTHEHGIWICLGNGTATFETAKWKRQLLTWIPLNRNRLCIFQTRNVLIIFCFCVHYILMYLW